MAFASVKNPLTVPARDAMAAGVLFLALLVLFIATATRTGGSIDTLATWLPAWHLVRDGNFTMTGLLHNMPWFVPSGHRLVSNRFPGAIFFAVPFYALFGSSPSPDKGPSIVAAATATAFAVVLLFFVFRQLVDFRLAVTGALGAALATSMWSVSADALWTHTVTGVCLSAAILAIARDRQWIAGVLLGYAVFSRPHVALAAAAIGLGLAVSQRSLWPPLRIGLGSGAGLAGLFVYNHHMFRSSDVASSVRGGYDSYATNYGGVGLHHFLENIAGALVSPERGIFVMSPFLLLLALTLLPAWRAAVSWVRVAAIAGVVEFVAPLWVNHFSGGSAFYSYRVVIEALVLMSPLLLMSYVVWWHRSARRRLIFATVTAASVGIQAVGAVLYVTDTGLPNAWRTSDFANLLTRHPGAGWSVFSAALICTLAVSRLMGARRPRGARMPFASASAR